MKAILMVLCLVVGTALAQSPPATYFRDSAGRVVQVIGTGQDGKPATVDYRYTDDNGQPTDLVYAMRLNGGQWCNVSDRANLPACLRGAQ